MKLKAKIATAIIFPVYTVLLVSIIIALSLLKLIFGIMNFLGIISAVEFLLIKTREVIVIWEFRRKLSKEDRKVMDSKEE